MGFKSTLHNVRIIQNTRRGRINSNGVSDQFVCTTDGQVTRQYTVYASELGYVPGPATVRVGAFYTDEALGYYTGAEDVVAFAIQLRASR